MCTMDPKHKSSKPPSTLTEGSGPREPKRDDKAEMELLERPFPWNTFSDSTYRAIGTFILFMIAIPSMSVTVVLSRLLGNALHAVLYEHNPVGRYILNILWAAQRSFFRWVGNFILLDPRDSSYLPWLLWCNFVQAYLFYLAYDRYQRHGGLEVSTFLIYHLLRIGPSQKMMAHQATLAHKEGHAKSGLFRDILSEKRKPLPKWIRNAFADHLVAGISGIFYGTIPNHYATAHNKIHHRWHNDTGDVHTNMDFDRSQFGSFVLYLPRFVGYWTGITPLILFWSRGEYQFFNGLLVGMVYYYGAGFYVWYKVGFGFYWAYMLHPFLEMASVLCLVAYMWHMFSDEANPANQYVNSITILRGTYNVWNEDYHVVHHHEPFVHWSDAPASFENYLERYVECRATVFGDCEQGKIIAWIFGCKWDDLADHFVDLQYTFSNGEANKDKNKRFTVQQIQEYERELGKKKDAEILEHHAEIRAMLLNRLTYHYRGSRKDQWRKLTERARDFDKELDGKQS